MPRTLVLLLLLIGCAGGCAQFGRAGDVGRDLVDFFRGNTPIRAVGAMEDSYFADQRRQGINRLVSRRWGQRDPYTDRYAQIAQFDSDYLVRATAIRALNRSRDRDSTPVFVKALADPNPLVRQEAAKALANMPDPQAIPELTRILGNADEARDVRIAAADALRHYREITVARALAGTLAQRDFGVSWQSRRSLVAMTGHDLRYDEARWLEYLTGAGRPFG